MGQKQMLHPKTLLLFFIFVIWTPTFVQDWFKTATEYEKDCENILVLIKNYKLIYVSYVYSVSGQSIVREEDKSKKVGQSGKIPFPIEYDKEEENVEEYMCYLGSAGGGVTDSAMYSTPERPRRNK